MPRALLTLLLVLSLPATASAAVGWTDPFSVDEGVKERPVVSTLGSQQVTLVSDWAEMRIDFTRGAFGQEPGVRTYPAINGTPVGIALGQGGGSVAMTAVWGAVTAEDGFQFHAVTEADPEQVVQVSAAPPVSVGASGFDANDAGDAALVWVENQKDVKMVRFDRDGSISGVVSVGSAASLVSGGPSVAVSPGGNVLVAFGDLDQTGPETLSSARFFEYGTDAEPLAAVPAIAGAPDVAVTYAGPDMYALLQIGQTGVVRGRPPGEAWDSEIQVSQTVPEGSLRAAGNASGDAVFAWLVDGANDDVVVAAHRDAGDPAHTVTPDGQVSDSDGQAPVADIDSAGNSVIAFGAGAEIFTPAAVRRSRDGDWTSEESLGAETEYTPEADMDNGNIVVAWRDEETARLAGLDRSAPFFVDTQFGARTAALGEPINLCVSADDDWGPIAYTWAFSDGTTDSGPCVNHPLTQAGAQSAVVTISDQLGNSTTGEFPLTITGGAVIPPVVDNPPTAAIGKLRRKRISGTAFDDKGIAKVEVGLARRGKRCTQLRSPKRRRFTRVKARPCAPKRLFAGKGTTSWSLKLGKRLKKGRYVVRVRVTDTAGAATTATRKFKLR